MCARCEEIEELILLAELETEVILAEAADGFSIPQANRPLTEAERRAGTRFGEIATMHDEAEAAALGILGDVERVVEDELVTAIFGPAETVTGAAVLRALAEVNAAQPKPVQTAVLAAASALGEVYRGVYARAAAIVRDEAVRQGSKPAALAELPDVPVRDFVAPAASAAMNPWTRTTTHLQKVLGAPAAVARPAVGRDEVRATLSSIPLDQSLDLARQGINQAAARGRHEIAATLEPSEIWASEIMDGATCGPCAAIDGKEYATLAEARDDYPHGGYLRCDGDARCRGTLVYIFPAGQDAPPPPPDRTPPPEPAPVAPVAPAPGPGPAAPTPAPAPSTDSHNLPGPTPEGFAARPRRPKGQPQRFTALNQLPIKDPGEPLGSILEDATATNPDFDATHKTRVYNNNCTHTTSVLELRRRGYDVTAAPVKGGAGRYDSEYLPFWRDPATGRPPVYRKHPGGQSELEADILAREPDGARGIVCVTWKSGGGHVFNYERVGNEIRYIEPQSGNPDASGHLARAKASSIEHFRMDHLEATDYLAKEAVAARPPEYLAELAAKSEILYRKKWSEGRPVYSAEGWDFDPPRFRKEGKDYVRLTIREREAIRDEWRARQARADVRLRPKVDPTS